MPLNRREENDPPGVLQGPSQSSEETAARQIRSHGFELDDGIIAARHMADGSVNTQKLADLAVSAAKLQGSSVEATKIANAAVGTAAIADLAVGDAKIANVSADKIEAGTITASAVGVDTVLTLEGTGVFQSASTGARIEITQSTQERIRFFDANNNLAGQVGTDTNILDTLFFRGDTLELESLSGGNATAINYRADFHTFFGASVFDVNMAANFDGRVDVDGAGGLFVGGSEVATDGDSTDLNTNDTTSFNDGSPSSTQDNTTQLRTGSAPGHAHDVEFHSHPIGSGSHDHDVPDHSHTISV